MTENIYYQWVAVSNATKPFVRLVDIRLFLLYDDTFISAVPVLKKDGKDPRIVPACSNVFRIGQPGRKNKLVNGRLTEKEKETATPVQLMYNGPWKGHPIYQSIAEELLEKFQMTQASPFKEPMWCRWSKNHETIIPRDTAETRIELGAPKGNVSRETIRELWNEVAGTPFVMGTAGGGMLFEFGAVLSGGVVVVPSKRMQDETGEESFLFDGPGGVCRYQDFMNMQKSLKWRLL